MKVETLKGRGWLAVGGDKHQVSYTLTAFQPLVERLRRSRSFTFKGKLDGLSKSFISENHIAAGEKLELRLSDERRAMIILETSGDFIVTGPIMPRLLRFGTPVFFARRKPTVPTGE